MTYPDDVVRAFAASLIHDLLDATSTELKKRSTRYKRIAVGR